MKKGFMFFISMLVISFSAKCQDESIFNRINGVKIKGNIYVKFDPQKKFQYLIDKDEDWHDLDDGLFFNVKNQHKNNFRVYVEFYNPLRYSIKSSQKDLDDPSYQAISDFIAKLPSVSSSDVSQADSKKISVGNTGASVAQISELTPINNSVLLYEWIYTFLDNVDTDKIKNDPYRKRYNEIVEQVNNIKSVEDYLYGKINLRSKDGNNSVSDWVKEANKNLYNVDNDYNKFNTELATTKETLKDLNQNKDEAEKNIKDISALISTKFDSDLSDLLKPNKREAFKQYSTSTATALIAKTKHQFETQGNTIKTLSNLSTKLQKFIDDFKGAPCGRGRVCDVGYKVDYNVKLDWKTHSMKQFAYDAKVLDENGTEDIKAAVSTSMTVAKRLGVYPFVSTGVLYTNFSYPNYAISTDTGVNKVAKTEDTKVRVRPSVFLNMLIDSWDPVYPFAQIGITTGTNDVLFPVGVGFSFGSSFSISGGIILGYVKDLTNLHVGDTVKDEAALKNDLSNKGTTSWYFSINYNLGKK